MFTVSQAARRLGVCSQTIRRWDRSGLIKCHRTPGNHRRISLAEINRLLGKMHRELIREQPPKKRAAIDARVSGHRQKTDGDLDRQLKTLTKACRQRLSYNLSSNLWGKVIDTVRYMRESLGHSKYSVWTVNPRYTSQTCHVCGERGKRVEDENSTTKKKGGEYFYCEKCKEHFHADVNAARNIIHVQDNLSSAAPGRSA